MARKETVSIDIAGSAREGRLDRIRRLAGRRRAFVETAAMERLPIAADPAMWSDEQLKEVLSTPLLMERLQQDPELLKKVMEQAAKRNLKPKEMPKDIGPWLEHGWFILWTGNAPTGFFRNKHQAELSRQSLIDAFARGEKIENLPNSISYYERQIADQAARMLEPGPSVGREGREARRRARTDAKAEVGDMAEKLIDHPFYEKKRRQLGEDLIDVSKAPDDIEPPKDAVVEGGRPTAATRDAAWNALSKSKEGRDEMIQRDQGTYYDLGKFTEDAAKQVARRAKMRREGIDPDKMADDGTVRTAAQRKRKHSGAMLALMAPKEVSRALKKAGIVDEGTASSDGLHMTLLYLGKAKDIDKKTMEEIVRAAEKVCARHDPLDMRISGAGMFTPGEDGTPVYVVPNAKGLSMLQADLEDAIGNLIDLPSEHGWVPHMTMGYCSDGKPEIPDLPDFPGWTANKVRIQAGGEKVKDIPIGRGKARRAGALERILKAACVLDDSGDEAGLARLAKQLDLYLSRAIERTAHYEPSKGDETPAFWRRNMDYAPYEGSPWRGSLSEFKKRFPGGLKDFLEWRRKTKKQRWRMHKIKSSLEPLAKQASGDAAVVLEAVDLLETLHHRAHYEPVGGDDVDKLGDEEPKLWSDSPKHRTIEDFLKKYRKHHGRGSDADDGQLALDAVRDMIRYWSLLLKKPKRKKR